MLTLSLPLPHRSPRLASKLEKTKQTNKQEKPPKASEMQKHHQMHVSGREGDVLEKDPKRETGSGWAGVAVFLDK